MSFDKSHTHWTPPSLCSLMSPAMLGIYGRAPRYAGDAAAFDGVNDHIDSLTALSTAVDGREILLSAWFRFNSTAGDGVYQRIMHSTAGYFSLSKSTANNFSLDMSGSTGVFLGNWLSTGAYTSTSGWIHFMAAVDGANSSGGFWINGATDLIAASTIIPGSTPLLNRAHWAIGADVDGAQRAYVDMFDFYFNMSTDGGGGAAMLSKFYSGGRPISLGPTGALPTGADPIMFLHLDDGQDVTNFPNNLGSGSSFTIVGALTPSTSSPTD